MIRGSSRRILFSAAAVLLFFSLAEVGTRLLGVGASHESLYARVPTILWSDRSAVRAFLEFAAQANVGVSDWEDLAFFQSDEVLRCRLRPDLNWEGPFVFAPPGEEDLFRWSVRTNSEGFRTPLRPRAKPPGVVRIVCLGDSCTFGWGLRDEDTYPAQLEAALNAHGDSARYEVINLGVPGYTSYCGLRLLGDYALAFSPDYVTIAYGANDMIAYTLPDEEWASSRWMWSRRVSGLLGRSRLFGLLQAGLLRGLDGLRGEDPGVPRVAPKRYLHNLSEMVTLAEGRGAQVAILEMTGCMSEQYSRELADLSLTRHLPRVRMEETARRWFERGGDRSDPWASKLTEIHGAREVAENPSLLYTIGDGCHPNQVGSRFLAEELARWIRRGEPRAPGDLPAPPPP